MCWCWYNRYQSNQIYRFLLIYRLTNRYWFLSIDYPGCSSVWGNTVESNINKLQLVQNFTARIVLGLKKLNIISEGHRSLKWLNNYEKILFNDLVLVLKCLNGLATSYLAHYFTTRLAIHSRNTRRSWRLEPSTLDGCQQGNVVFIFTGLNGGMTCQRTFRTLKTWRFLRKDYLFVYLTIRLHYKEFLYLIYCSMVYFLF